MTWALLPVKDLLRAKTRLAGVLSPAQRRELAGAMVEDVLRALSECAGLAGVLVVSDDPVVESLAGRYDVELVGEASLGCSGLNPVIAAGCARLESHGAQSIAVVHSDLPLLTTADVTVLLEAFADAETDAVLSPDRERRGTNVLIFETGRLRSFRYGPDSCAAHRRLALAAGLRLQVLPLDRVALDIDEPDDLLALSRHCRTANARGYTAQLLETPQVRHRLDVLEGANPQGNRSTGT